MGNALSICIFFWEIHILKNVNLYKNIYIYMYIYILLLNKNFKLNYNKYYKT